MQGFEIQRVQVSNVGWLATCTERVSVQVSTGLTRFFPTFIFPIENSFFAHLWKKRV